MALISTAIVVGLGFTLFLKINISNNEDADNDNVSAIYQTKSQSDLQSVSSQSTTQEITSSSFSHPGIVPQGTSININGSTQMLQLNQALQKSFQQHYPGTVVNTNTDGSDKGIELLRLGKIDIAAIDRPLNVEEKAAGLVIVTVGSLTANQKQTSKQAQLSYVYQEPASLEVEAFLGHAFSAQGQQAIAGEN
ncbi:MAG: substrate-binding domain-containing protein [Waterburya sp.]